MKKLPHKQGSIVVHRVGALAVKSGERWLHLFDDGWFWLTPERFEEDGLEGWRKLPDADERDSGTWEA